MAPGSIFKKRLTVLDCANLCPEKPDYPKKYQNSNAG
jgi:hypothetical protein